MAGEHWDLGIFLHLYSWSILSILFISMLKRTDSLFFGTLSFEHPSIILIQIKIYTLVSCNMYKFYNLSKPMSSKVYNIFSFSFSLSRCSILYRISMWRPISCVAPTRENRLMPCQRVQLCIRYSVQVQHHFYCGCAKSVLPSKAFLIDIIIIIKPSIFFLLQT